jgi:hypothetical protein
MNNYKKNNQNFEPKKENLKNKSAKYYKENKEKILKNMKKKVECDECKSIVCKAYLTKHKKMAVCKKNKEAREKIYSGKK